MGKMENNIKKGIIESYAFRLKALGLSFKYSDYKTAFSKIPGDKIYETLSNLVRNKETAIGYLTNLGVKVKDSVNNLTDKIKKQLNLSNVTEFNHDNKDYFKFKDSNNQIYVVRNLGEDSKELFTNILNESSINYGDGKKNASEIFKKLNEKKFIEIKMKKEAEIENKNSHQVSVIKSLEKQFPEREIITSLEENFYIVKGNETEKDILLSPVYENGKVTLKQISQKTYGSKIDVESSKKEESNNFEIPNEIMLELENDIELENMINEGLDNNLNDETISNIAEKNLIKKNRKFENINLALALSIIISNIRLKRKNATKNHKLGGRQYVLTPNLYRNNAS